MSGITLAQAQAQLDAWLEASLKVAANQSYTIDGRSYTRADAGEIARQVSIWEARVERLSGGRRGGFRVRQAAPGG